MTLFTLFNNNSFALYQANYKYAFENVEDLRHVDFSKIFYKDIYCFAICYFDKSDIHLNWIITNPLFCNMGYATALIEKVNNIGIQLGLKYIKLDDCCDKLPPKNIYYKLGFQVKHGKKWVDWIDKHIIINEDRRKKISKM